MTEKIKTFIVSILSFYQYWISPMLGPHCRFEPTCSSYAKEAITHHSLAYSFFLTIRRISKCHPYHPGGYDPVPKPKIK